MFLAVLLVKSWSNIIQTMLELTSILITKEDIALFAEMGFKCFRTSIAWTRIFLMVMKQNPMKKITIL